MKNIMRKVISFIYLISVCINIVHAQTYDSIEKEFGSLIDNLAKDFSQHDYILSDANLIYELANRNTLLADDVLTQKTMIFKGKVISATFGEIFGGYQVNIQPLNSSEMIIQSNRDDGNAREDAKKLIIGQTYYFLVFTTGYKNDAILVQDYIAGKTMRDIAKGFISINPQVIRENKKYVRAGIFDVIAVINRTKNTLAQEFGLEVSNDIPNFTAGSTVGGHEYYGMINEKYPIVMRLGWREPNEIGGSYYYVKNGRNNTLELSGSMNSNDYMVLKEYNSAGENTGTFEGKWSLNSYSGTFTNYKGVKMPFKLYSETTATNDSDIIFNSYQKSNTSSISNSLSSFFSKNVGKYPSDINLLEFPLLKTRLIALVGNNNYNFIKTYFQVVTPIKLGFNKNPNLYEVSGGEEHNCMSNNTTIVYNQQLDNLTVQLIKEGSDPFIFQEKKDDSPFE